MTAISVIALCLLLVSVGYTHFKTKYQETAPVDAFEMISSFPYLAMVYTSSDDPEFKCATATLTYLNEQTKDSTYVWHFKSPINHHTVVRTSTFDISQSDNIDQVHFILDGNQCEVYTAYYNYTDYENCIVSIIPYYGENLCILWVAQEKVNNIPEKCLAAHHATCPVEYRAYESDICDA
nr:uncharacterized protein LOC119168087 [Rhipicephalus microplus]